MLPTPISGLGGLMCHWGEVLLYMPADVPHSNFGAWRAYAPLGRGAAVHASCYASFLPSAGKPHDPIRATLVCPHPCTLTLFQCVCACVAPSRATHTCRAPV